MIGFISLMIPENFLQSEYIQTVFAHLSGLIPKLSTEGAYLRKHHGEFAEARYILAYSLSLLTLSPLLVYAAICDVKTSLLNVDTPNYLERRLGLRILGVVFFSCIMFFDLHLADLNTRRSRAIFNTPFFLWWVPFTAAFLANVLQLAFQDLIRFIRKGT